MRRTESGLGCCLAKSRPAAVLQSAVKRYKVTGTGKVMVRKPGKQHINEKKRPNRLSRLGKTMQVLPCYPLSIHRVASPCAPAARHRDVSFFSTRATWCRG